MRKIDFISACDGEVVLHFKGSWSNKSSASPLTLAKIMKKHGFDEDGYMSSSMDFASEYGFKSNGGAMKLYEKARKLMRTKL